MSHSLHQDKYVTGPKSNWWYERLNTNQLIVLSSVLFLFGIVLLVQHLSFPCMPRWPRSAVHSSCSFFVCVCVAQLCVISHVLPIKRSEREQKASCPGVRTPGSHEVPKLLY